MSEAGSQLVPGDSVSAVDDQDLGILVQYQAARAALAAARTLDEVKHVADRATALRACAKVAHDYEAERDCIEMRTRAERRLGELLARGAADRAGVGRPRKKNGSVEDPFPQPATLVELYLDKHVADRARQLSSVSEEVFEQGLRQWRIGLRCYVAGEAGVLREIALVAGGNSPNVTTNDGTPSAAALAASAAFARGRETNVTIRDVHRAQAVVRSGDSALVGAVEIGALTLSAPEKLVSLAPQARAELLSALSTKLRADGALATDDTMGVVLRRPKGWVASQAAGSAAFAAAASAAPVSEALSEEVDGTTMTRSLPPGAKQEIAAPDLLLSRVESLWGELREALQAAADAGLTIPRALLSEMRACLSDAAALSTHRRCP
jgi:hypothetical protein